MGYTWVSKKPTSSTASPSGSGTMIIAENTSSEWFEEALRCYLEFHQACPWCGGTHCVNHVQRGPFHTFSCQTCDFEVVHDESTGVYRHIVGEVIEEQPDTMFAV